MTETRELDVITEALAIIDRGLGEMLHRELVSTDEVADLLLDVRTLLSAPREPAANYAFARSASRVHARLQLPAASSSAYESSRQLRKRSGSSTAAASTFSPMSSEPPDDRTVRLNAVPPVGPIG